MNIQEIMDTELVTVDPETPVVEAAKRMRDHSLGLLPVIEDERLIGVITDRDLRECQNFRVRAVFIRPR